VSDRSELALQLTDAVAAAHQAVQRSGDRAFRSFGLSHRAHAALSAVDQGGPDGARPSDVARAMGVSRAAATTFIQRLEVKGLVETTTDPDDDRGVRVTLSRHGLEVLLRVGQLERRLAARTIAPAAGIPSAAGAETARGGTLSAYADVRIFMHPHSLREPLFHIFGVNVNCGKLGRTPA